MLEALKPSSVVRYTDLLRLIVRYGRTALGEASEGELEAGTEPARDELEEAAAFARDLERLGPTYVKLGQLLSTRADLLADPWIEALGRLQAEVKPFESERAKEIFADELGIAVDEAFARFDDTPLAAASLAQVHYAELRNGRRVVVKIQRPEIRQRIADDLDALDTLASWVDAHTELGRQIGFSDLISQLRHGLDQELDLRQEARNLDRLREVLDGSELVTAPSPTLPLCSRRVLTMDYVEGRKVTSLTPLARLEIEGEALAEALFVAYLDQILVHGFLHADPHPGNVLLSSDGEIVLIDAGLTGSLGQSHRDALLRLLLALSEADADACFEAALELGQELPDFAADGFKTEIEALVQRLHGARLDEIDVGRVLFEMMTVATENGLRPSSELALVAKALLDVDAVAGALAPRFDPQQVIRERAPAMVRRHSLSGLAPSRLLGSLLETQRLVEQVPSRVRSVLSDLAAGELRLKIDALDEDRLIGGLEKVGNRIAAGLVIAALLMSGTLLMRLDRGTEWLGYPIVALAVLAAAVALAVCFAAGVVLADWRERRRAQREEIEASTNVR